MEPSLGTIVTIPQGRGVVRFIGATSFSTGTWVGVELSEKNGKNDGSVNGTSYFNCKMGYGVFIRQSQVKSMHGSEIDGGPSVRPAPAIRAAGHQRTPSTGVGRSNSFRSSASSNPSPRNGSPRSQSPAKHLAAPPPTTARAPRPGLNSPTKRVSPGSLQARKSISLRPTRSQDSPVPSSPSPRNTEHASRVYASSPSGNIVQRTSSPLALPPHGASPSPQNSPTIPKAPSLPPSPINTFTPRVQDDQEIQELRAKIRVLEAKRADDARHVRELETRLSDAESFVALRPKLQAKLNSQHTELIAARRELAEAQQLSQLAETRMLDTQEQLEMAMLDKEVAEERAEIAEAELEEVKEKLAVTEVEMGVLKDGDAPDGADAPTTTGKGSLAYIQLEKQNERLKEALIRLDHPPTIFIRCLDVRQPADLSQETEQEQRRRISEMEKDIVGVDDLQCAYFAHIPIRAEDLLVQLTERNLVLGEKIEEMRITIEDLESLKELNDELEENHIETEKGLHEDLEKRDTQIREYAHKIELLEEGCQDLENTIGQFRELVFQLQNELDQLRTQTQTAQHESATAASQTAAMMSLNLKLQSSASKNQAKNIELEIKKLEAKETRELLNIIQPYLPQIYVESDSDATSCYLFFQRLAYKADLINTVVAQTYGLPESLDGPVSEILVGVCEMKSRISGLSVLCKRFAAVLRKCDVESFLNIGRIYPEIAPMEKRLDMHIDLLRRDEFREMECVSDIAKIQAQFDHLAETYFDIFEHDIGEREIGYVMSYDHDLDMFAASIGLTKTSISNIIQDEDAVLDMGGYNIETELLAPLQGLLDQCKGAKVLSKKLTKRLEDLVLDNSALKLHLVPQMKGLNNFIAELVNFGISLAQQVMPHLSDVRSSKTSFQLTTILSFVKQTASSTVAKDLKPGASMWEAIALSITQLIYEGGKLLPLAMESENVLKISGIAPWVTRIEEIKASMAINVEAERKLSQLNDEMQGLVRTLKAKEQSIQESSVKIELMDRRMEAVKKQADTITDLESELSKARKQERAYEEAMEQLQTDLDTLEQDNAKLKTAMVGHERQVSGAPVPEVEPGPVEGNLETSHLLEQIDALRGTVRFLRTENSYLKGQDLLREIEALPPLAQPLSRMPTPPLEPSSLSDSDSDSESDTPRPPTTILSLATETKLLYRDVIKFSSSPRVVDLSVRNATMRGEQGKGGKVWMPRKKTPAHQVWARKMEADHLSQRVRGLLDRANAIA
ncbi:dynein associated protein-domain-containing protein [Infundibulicybe gibba]|nr:dynein associated protein-domain-containing protein [Infundibulicybe gibba]